MAQSIRIRRTLSTLPPTGLAAGELAIEMNSVLPRLWVGVPQAVDLTERRLVAGPEVYLPLSGGTIGGNLEVIGTTTVDGGLTVNAVGIQYAGIPQFPQPQHLIAFEWTGSELRGWVNGTLIGTLAAGGPFLPLSGGTLSGDLYAPNIHLSGELDAVHARLTQELWLTDRVIPGGTQYAIYGETDAVVGAALRFWAGSDRLLVLNDGTVMTALGGRLRVQTSVGGPEHLLVDGALVADATGCQLHGQTTVVGEIWINALGIQYRGLPVAEPQHVIGFDWDSQVNLRGWVDGGYIGTLATTAHLGAYLPLTGGTLSGPLTIFGAAVIAAPVSTFYGQINLAQAAVGPELVWLGFGRTFDFSISSTTGDFVTSEGTTGIGQPRLSIRAGNGVVYVHNGLEVASAHTYRPGGGAWLDLNNPLEREVIGPYPAGLSEICALEPIIWRLNSGPAEGETGGGLDPAAARAIMPDLVREAPPELRGDRAEPLFLFDASNLPYALINAVKELAERVAAVERRR